MKSAMITVRPRSAKALEPDTARSAEVAQATVELPEQKTALKEIIAGGGERPDVTEAAIIVTGGRSLGSAENFRIIENFADSIGAAVGSSRAAVDAGYRRALTTIIDSNLTTLIAAVLLFQFGTGPIKGFAVTLSIGILTSMFTALMLTRLFVVVWLRRRRPQTLPI